MNIWLYRDRPPTASWINGNFFKLWAVKQCENFSTLIDYYYFLINFVEVSIRTCTVTNVLKCCSIIQPQDPSVLKCVPKASFKKGNCESTFLCLSTQWNPNTSMWYATCESEGLLVNTRKHLILHSHSSLCFIGEAATRRQPKRDLVSRWKLVHCITSSTKEPWNRIFKFSR